MSSPILWLVVLVIVVLSLGLGRSRAARRASRVVSLVGFAFFGLVAAASLVGMVVLADRGGGALLFLALPAGFIAWLFLNALSASRDFERMQSLPADARRDRTLDLLDQQIAAQERVVAERTRQLESFWITPAKRRRLRDDLGHARLMSAGLARMRGGLTQEQPEGEVPRPEGLGRGDPEERGGLGDAGA